MVIANVFRGRPWGTSAATMLMGFTVGLVGLFGAADLAGLGGLYNSTLNAQSRYALDAGAIVTAVAAAGFLLPPIRRDVAMVLPIDPADPVHIVALVFATLLLGTQVTSIAFTDVLAANQALPPLGLADLFASELPFLIAAFAGVGVFIHRSLPGATVRLGVVRPAWWHIPLALAAAGLFFVAGQQSDALSHALTPDVARQVDTTTQHVFGGLNGPLDILALALLPGVCEELLFRGALQPRLGLFVTAALFTSIHTQYGLSVDTATVFVLALGLGLIRKYTNTTTSATCHVSYNLLASVGIAGALTAPAVAVEVVLVAVGAYGIWSSRRKRSEPALTSQVADPPHQG